MTREEFAQAIMIGHNLGNGLESIEPSRDNGLKVTVEREVTDENGYHDHKITIYYPDYTFDTFYSYEEIWSNVPVTSEWFARLAADGTTAVRIPVNCMGHVFDRARNEIDPLWLKRIREVIDMAIANGLKVILTLHGDFGMAFVSSNFISLTNPMIGDNQCNTGTVLNMWTQLATLTNDISCDDLAFELTNEFQLCDLEVGLETGTITKDYLASIAVELYRRIYKKVRAVGGNAAERFLLIGGYRNDPTFAIEKFVDLINNEFDDKCFLTCCYYTPWEFTVCDRFENWRYVGDIKTRMDEYLEIIKNVKNNLGIPIVVTEYGVGANLEIMDAKDKRDIINYIYFVMKMLYENGIPACIWDPGYLLKRDTIEYSIPFMNDMIQSIINGEEFDIETAITDNYDNIVFGKVLNRVGTPLNTVENN